MQISTDPIQAFIQWLIDFWNSWWPLIIPIIVVVLTWIALAIIASLLIRVLRRRVSRGGIPPDAINGLVLAIRLLFIWLGIVALATNVPLLWGYALEIVGSASVIIGLAGGLAISLAMRNFVAGLYILISDPFDIGDYVRIGSNEGIVLEISLNYTKLRQIDGSITLIPNNNVMNSSVTNFRFKRKRQQVTSSKTEDGSAERNSLPRRIWEVISQVMDTSDLIQYTLELKFPVKESNEKYESILSEVCKRWTEKFGFEPVYALTSISHVAFTYAFTIFVEDPQVLLEYRSAFIEDIGRAIY
ncbi:MAG: mechanosensitive ion channel family protein [Promethearchaeota archaeon]